MKKLATLAFLLAMGISSAYAADKDANEPVDWDAIQTVSPIAYNTLRELETNRGAQIKSIDELNEVIKSPEYQDSYIAALIEFCENPDNATNKNCSGMEFNQ